MRGLNGRRFPLVRCSRPPPQVPRACGGHRAPRHPSISRDDGPCMRLRAARCARPRTRRTHARAAYMHAAHSRCDRATADIAQSRARGPAPGQHARPAAVYDARHGRGGTNASAAGRRPHDAVQTSQHACTALQRVVLRCNVLCRVATCCTALQRDSVRLWDEACCRRAHITHVRMRQHAACACDGEHRT